MTMTPQEFAEDTYSMRDLKATAEELLREAREDEDLCDSGEGVGYMVDTVSSDAVGVAAARDAIGFFDLDEDPEYEWAWEVIERYADAVSDYISEKTGFTFSYGNPDDAWTHWGLYVYFDCNDLTPPYF